MRPTLAQRMLAHVAGHKTATVFLAACGVTEAVLKGLGK